MKKSPSLFKALLKNVFSKKVNRDVIGYRVSEVYPAQSEQQIRDYAQATKDNMDLYNDTNPVLPPFYVARLAFPLAKKIMVHPQLKMNILKMVHGEIGLRWIKTVHAQDVLNIAMSLEQVEDTSAGELVKLKAVTTREGETVAEADIGLMVKTAQPVKKKKEDPPAIPAQRFTIEFATHEGQQLEYAKASGDNNFIHTNNVLAKLAGLPRTIMHGMCVMAMSCNALADELVDQDRYRMTEIKGRFAKPVLPGQKLTLIGYKSDDANSVPFEVINQKGALVIKNGLFCFQQK